MVSEVEVRSEEAYWKGDHLEQGMQEIILEVVE